MKSNIHPKYYADAKVTCSCGNKFTTGSTLPEIKVDICSACHPFFTGEMKFVDTQGRVEKFESKRKRASKYLTKAKKKADLQKAADRPDNQPKTLREMLETVKSPQTPPKTASSKPSK